MISCKLNWHGWRESQRALSPLVRKHLQTAPVGRHHGGNRACRLPVWATQESRLTSLCVRHPLLIWLYSSCFVGPNFVIVNAVNGQTSKNGAAACHPPRILKGCSHHCNLHVAGADRDPASKLREVNKRRCRVSESILQFAMQNDKADMQRQKQEVHIGACMSMLRVHFHFVCGFRIPNKFHARVVGRFQMSAWKRWQIWPSPRRSFMRWRLPVLQRWYPRVCQTWKSMPQSCKYDRRLYLAMISKYKDRVCLPYAHSFVIQYNSWFIAYPPGH